MAAALGSVSGIASSDAENVGFPFVVQQFKDNAVGSDADAPLFRGDVDEAAEVRVAGFREAVKQALDPARGGRVEGVEVLFRA